MTNPDPNAPLPSDRATEPAVSSGSLVGAASLVVSALVSFGIPLDSSQKLVIIAGITFIAPVITGVLIRAKVFSPETYYAVVEQLTNRITEAQRAVTEAKAAMNAQDVAHSASLEAVKAAIVPVMTQIANQAPPQAPPPYYPPPQGWGPQAPPQPPQQPAWSQYPPPQQGWENAPPPYDGGQPQPSPRPAARRHRYLDEEEADQQS